MVESPGDGWRPGFGARLSGRQAKRTGHRVGGSQEESFQAAEKAQAAAEAAQAGHSGALLNTTRPKQWRVTVRMLRT